MINPENRRIVHEYIIIDLAIRSLQQDLTVLETLKMSSLYVKITDSLLIKLRSSYYELKRQLDSKKIRVLSWQRDDEHFSTVSVATSGNNQSIQYANRALKKEVETKLKAILQAT